MIIINIKNIQAYDNNSQESKYFSQNSATDISGQSTIISIEKLSAITEK